MPWKRVDLCVHKLHPDGSTGEIIPGGCHKTSAEADAHVRALYAREAYSAKFAFEPFAKLAPGQPIRLFPEGRWYRGDRILDLDKNRLQDIVKNFKDGLPRFRVGFNLDHAEHQGKVGDVRDLAYMESGPKGPGVYITDYDLSTKGMKAIEEDGYDGVSGEIIWTLNDGARYQDPESGTMFDNVLTAVALTPAPFFGHANVALYSAERQADEVMDKQVSLLERIAGGLEVLVGRLAGTGNAEEMAVTKSESDGDHPAAHYLVVPDGEKPSTWGLRIKGMDGKADHRLMGAAWAAMHGGYRGNKYEGPDKQAAIGKLKTLYKSEDMTLPGENASDVQDVEELSATGAQEVIEMADEKELLEARQAAEKLTVDLRAAQDAEKVAKERADTLEAQIKAEKLTVRKAALKTEAESFKALAIKPDEYVEKFVALEDKDADVAEWFRAQLKAADGANREVMGEIGSAQENEGGESDQFLQSVEGILKETFSGDRSKYSEAMVLALVKFPKLAAAYQAQV